MISHGAAGVVGAILSATYVGDSGSYNNNNMNRIRYYILCHLLRWHIDTQMDQWEAWSIETTKGKAYIDIALRPTWGHWGHDGWYKPLP
jgi:hypothetical protein